MCALELLDGPLAIDADPLREDPLAVVGDELPGRLHSWDISVGVDGPGARFVGFLAGCPLRCLYCQNPDTWQMRRGQQVTVRELVDRIARYRAFVTAAHGGVTLSGGEPLLQARFVEHVFRTVKEELGLHTALDTSGYLGERASDELLRHTDLVLLDVKSSDPGTYRRVTSGELAPTLRFGRRLAEMGVPIWVRFVCVPGLTDAEDNVAGVARYAASLGTVEHVDVLPFHKLGQVKYDELGMRFPLADVPVPGEELLDRVRGQFAAEGLLAI